MIGSIISAVAGLGSGIFGAIESSRNAKLAQDQMRERDDFNRAMFNRQYYQDALSRNDTQNFLRTLRNDMRQAVEQQNNAAVITGQTPEAIAATKEANAKAYADAIAGIDATNSARKDQALATHQAAQNQAFADWAKNYNQQSQNWSNFASQAFGIGMQGVAGVADGLYKPATAATPTPTATNDIIETQTTKPYF